MSDAAGLVVLAGRIIFAFFFGFVAGWGAHVKMSSMMEGFAKQTNFPSRRSQDGPRDCGSSRGAFRSPSECGPMSAL